MPRAPKICGKHFCARLIHDGGTGCPEHRRLPFEGKAPDGNRTASAPHKAQRARVLKRDPFCKLAFPGCLRRSVIMDHVVPTAVVPPNYIDDSTVQGACVACSDKKTSAEANYLRGAGVPRPWTDEAEARARA